jgi:hypothetical protein
MREMMKDRFMENLPPEARQRFEAAREKALQDPQIRELREKTETANREFFQAMRKKMMEIDPGLEEIVKQNAPRERGGADGKKGQRPEGRRDNPGFGALTEPERDRLMAAREKAKADPAVVEAEKKKSAAQTPEERRAAGEQFRKAMNDAVLRADPSLGPVLEKLAPRPPVAPPPPPPAPLGPGGDGENMMMQPQ